MNSGDADKSEKKKSRPNPKKRLMMRMRQENQSKNRTKQPTPPSSLPQNTADGPAIKKARFEEGKKDGEILSIKMLIPSSAIGALIGRNGQELSNLKRDHNCQVQISKNGDTYPGTSERICHVKGRLNNIVAVIESIQDKIRKKCANQVENDAFDFDNTPRGNETKIVIPNTSAGMVIGKSGYNLKFVRNRFGSKVEIYPKVGSVEAKTALERVVTVAHEESSALLKSICRVLKNVSSNPHHCSKINKEDFEKAEKGKEKEKEQEKEKEKEKEQEEEEKRDSPIQEDDMERNLCLDHWRTCLTNCQENFYRTREVVGCPAQLRGHPTTGHIQRWVNNVERQRAQEVRRERARDLERERARDARRAEEEVERRRNDEERRRAREAQRVADEAERRRNALGSELE